MRCDECMYWGPLRQCHRYPPAMAAHPTTGRIIELGRPAMDADDFCGEFRRKRKDHSAFSKALDEAISNED